MTRRILLFFLLIFSISLKNGIVNAADSNPSVPGAPVSVDFSNVVLSPPISSEYSNTIYIDDSHRINLKCWSDSVQPENLEPCKIMDGSLSIQHTDWVPIVHTSHAKLYFDPPALSISGVLSGSMGENQRLGANVSLQTNIGSILTEEIVSRQFTYNFYGAGATYTLVSDLLGDFNYTTPSSNGDENAFLKLGIKSLVWTEYQAPVVDLVIGEVDVSFSIDENGDPKFPSLNEYFYVNVPVTAVGTIQNGDPREFPVDIKNGDKIERYQNTVVTLLNGSVKFGLPVKWVPDETGKMTLSIVLNNNRAVKESDYTNNSATLVVGGGGRGKIKVKSMDLEGNVLGSMDKDISGSTLGLSVPLGGIAELSLFDDQGSPVLATYSYSSSVSFNPPIPEEESKWGLYLDRLALIFNEGAMTSSQQLMAVHTGTQTISVKPNSTKIAPFVINLSVLVSNNVGVGNSQFDADILYYAHIRGIPPQIIKGIIAHESKFKIDAFRYEPVSYDFKYYGKSARAIGLMGRYIIGQKRNEQSITDNLIHPRSRYGLAVGRDIVAIPDNYERAFNQGNSLSCDAILAINNKGVTGTIFGAQNWTKQPVSFIQSDIDPTGKLFANVNVARTKFGFPAQTIAASSYGLMQPMFESAARYAEFKVNGVASDPIALLNATTNIRFATRFYNFVFTKANGGSLRAQSVIRINSIDEIEEKYRMGMHMYNAGPGAAMEGFVVADNPEHYNFKVWSQVENYMVNETSKFVGN